MRVKCTGRKKEEALGAPMVRRVDNEPNNTP